MLSKELNKNSGDGSDRRIWNNLGIMLVTLELAWVKLAVEEKTQYRYAEITDWLRIYTVYTSI